MQANIMCMQATMYTHKYKLINITVLADNCYILCMHIVSTASCQDWTCVHSSIYKTTVCCTAHL